VYGVTTLEHPAVQMVAMERGRYYLGGKVQVRVVSRGTVAALCEQGVSRKVYTSGESVSTTLQAGDGWGKTGWCGRGVAGSAAEGEQYWCWLTTSMGRAGRCRGGSGGFN
jgi:hypothetical protein